MSDEKEYPGCRPGWKPDTMLAERIGAPSQSIEDQVANEQKHWALEQEQEATAPADPQVEDHDIS